MKEHEVIQQHKNKINPSHYEGNYGLTVKEVYENYFSKEELEGAYRSNVLKYVLRYKNKNGLEDLKKAREYLDWLIDLKEEQ